MTLTRTDALLGIHKVGKLYLELLFRCNFTCRHCYHGTDLQRPEAVTTEQALAALDYFAGRYGCRYVCFLGGEPLLYPKLPDLLAAARNRGYRTEICTNGYKRRTVLQSCLPNLDLLRVSLDGGIPKVHDRIRRLGSFAAAFETLAWAAGQRLPFGATCTLTADNIATIPELAMRLRDLGADELTLHRVRPVGNAATSGISEITWEQAGWLHAQITGTDLAQMRVNTEILLPGRCPAPADVLEKLEIAPDGRVYLSCAEVAGPGCEVRFDFDQATLVTEAAQPRSVWGDCACPSA